MRARPLWTVLVALTVLAACAAAPAPSAPPPPPTGLPAPRAGVVTFYLSLPGPAGARAGLAAAALAAAAPGGAAYRHFPTLAAAAARYGASDAQIEAVTRAYAGTGLDVVADPTRLFARVGGTPERWAAALRSPLAVQQATTASPFTVYGLPQQVPATLTPAGTAFLLGVAEVHEPRLEGPRPPGGVGADTARTGGAVEPFPLNAGSPLEAACTAPLLAGRQVYTPRQVHTAYGIAAAPGAAPVISVLDLGGGWLAGDLRLAGECFGFTPPQVDQRQGDGVAAAVGNADGETSLDLQTVAAVAPDARLRVVQSTAGGGALLDVFSRAIADPAGPPDVMSLSYGGCAIAEAQEQPHYVTTVDAVLAMAALVGVSTFVAAGDSGSTTCPRGSGVAGPSLSFPAVSAFVTAVGGTRLTLGAGNVRTGETVWNDAPYGTRAAGGGGTSRLVPRPDYQRSATPGARRVVPDVSALAAISPGWPVVTDGGLHTVGGTSGSSPLTAAATGLVAAGERAAGRPPLGLANGWFYAAAARPGAFFDVVTGNNDLAGVGCCLAGSGYDTASGLGVPDWAVLPATLPAPG